MRIRGTNFRLFARSTFFCLSLFIVLTSAEYIQCAETAPEEFLDFPVIHKSRVQKPLQVLDFTVVHNFNLALMQLVRYRFPYLKYPKLAVSKHVLTVVLRC